MNTGADDDRRSTPTFAFKTSSAQAIPLVASATRLANTIRANPVIRFFRSYYSSDSFGLMTT